MATKPTHNQGFTLIEMSIVLIIVGTIIGGLVVGKHLIRQSNIMSLATDSKLYISAVTQFKQKYNAMPGDMSNATSTWGTNANCGTFGAGTGTQTCNGNGDGHAGSTTDWMEGIYLWQHLRNGSFITGQYSGASRNQTSNGWYQPGYNCPLSKLSSSSGFAIRWVGILATDAPVGMTSWFGGDYGHVLVAGNQDNSAYADPLLAMLTPAEATNFDQKFDDGKPGLGKILALNSNYGTSCTTGTNRITSTYNNTIVRQACQVLFITGF